MAYRKPGVELTFVQRTLSPNVPTPTLSPAIVGEGYYVAEITDNPDSLFLASLTANTITGIYGISGYTGAYVVWSGLLTGAIADINTVTVELPSYCSGGFDSYSVYVDLVGSRYSNSGANAGKVRHLHPNEFTVTNATTTTPTITISGLGYDSVSISGLWTGSLVKVGFRARRTDLERYVELDGIDAIEQQIGKVCAENPLSLATYNALLNAGTVIYAYGTNNNISTAHASAADFLSSKELYVIAPLTQSTTDESTWNSHVNTYSSATNKKERIFIFSRGAHASLTDSTSKSTVASDLAAQAYERSNRRAVWVFPPVCYIQERKHISQLKPSYVQKMLVPQASSDTFSPSGLQARLVSTITLSDNVTKYYADSEITEAMWSGIWGDSNSSGDLNYITVKYPVPGYHLAAAVAGQIAGQPPQTPFTNLDIAGNIVEVKYSSDWFGETQLDTIAGGGNYIFHQKLRTSPIKCRHSLTTDMSSVERRELSITKVLDYTGKTLRDAFEPYVGKYNITPDLMGKLRTVVGAIKLILQREGTVSDLILESIEQDTVNPDTILISVLVKPFYPANYIKITLAF